MKNSIGIVIGMIVFAVLFGLGIWYDMASYHECRRIGHPVWYCIAN